MQALRLAELREGCGRRTVALSSRCKVLAAKARGLFVEGPLFYTQQGLVTVSEGRLAEEHHIVHVSASAHIAAVTQSGTDCGRLREAQGAWP